MLDRPLSRIIVTIKKMTQFSLEANKIVLFASFIMEERRNIDSKYKSWFKTLPAKFYYNSKSPLNLTHKEKE